LHTVYDPSFKIDKTLLHRRWGLPIFAAIMFLLFSSIFWLAQPFMEATDGLFSWFADQLSKQLPAGEFNSFIVQGVVGSIGAVMVFVPQIFILFLGIGFLESTGYLARAATIIDKPFSRLGMSGRAFVPILSGFACAVPAIMACRNLATERERKIASFILPFMTCSARLPVYALLLSFLFTGSHAWISGAVLALIYLLSLLMGAAAASILNRMLPVRESSFFMMELPLYRRPLFLTLMRATFDKTKAYVKKAGPMIFIFSIFIWLGTHFPKNASLEASYLGQVGRVMEPAVSPMGGDWRIGMGLISAFTARETFVSSLAVLMNVDDKEEDSQQQSLLNKMKEAVNSAGKPLFTVASITALILFFMLAMQCLSTFAIVLREIGSLKFALAQLVIFNLFAYVAAVGCFQVLTMII
jgi:ferrous iron transport protein B